MVCLYVAGLYAIGTSDQVIGDAVDGYIYITPREMHLMLTHLRHLPLASKPSNGTKDAPRRIAVKRRHAKPDR